MEITDDLVNAYYATSFHIFAPNRPITIAASGESPELKELHATRNVESSAFITAYSPLSEPTDTATNQKNQRKLISDVSGRWDFIPGEGVDREGKWPAEPGILVLGISLDEALSLGRKYNQHALIFVTADGSSELLACDPDNQSKLIHPLKRVIREKE